MLDIQLLNDLELSPNDIKLNIDPEVAKDVDGGEFTKAMDDAIEAISSQAQADIEQNVVMRDPEITEEMRQECAMGLSSIAIIAEDKVADNLTQIDSNNIKNLNIAINGESTEEQTQDLESEQVADVGSDERALNSKYEKLPADAKLEQAKLGPNENQIAAKENKLVANENELAEMQNNLAKESMHEENMVSQEDPVKQLQKNTEYTKTVTTGQDENKDKKEKYSKVDKDTVEASIKVINKDKFNDANSEHHQLDKTSKVDKITNNELILNQEQQEQQDEIKKITDKLKGVAKIDNFTAKEAAEDVIADKSLMNNSTMDANQVSVKTVAQEVINNIENRPLKLDANANEKWQPDLSQKIVLMLEKGVEQAAIKVEPPELGPLEIKLSMENNKTSIAFTSSHYLTKDILENSVAKLQDMLNNEGIDLVKVDVNLSEFNSSKQQYFADDLNYTSKTNSSSQEENNSQENGNVLGRRKVIGRGEVDCYV